jgi:2-polyprenyl-3-methyl-5-hydroxy-6-metoxy-1,4-benzoquinol methylase
MEYPELSPEVAQTWNANASWWSGRNIDEQPINRLLLRPALDRLLAVREGEQVLDLACGNGWLARHIAASGAEVLACDSSEEFIRYAGATDPGVRQRITYLRVDLTNERELTAIARGRFDAAVCCMALMDIPDIRPLLRLVTAALKTTGRFVFSIPHPCFHAPGYTIVAERADLDGTVEMQTSVKVREYLNMAPRRCAILKDQPREHYYFHRTLSALISLFSEAGLVLEVLDEPSVQSFPTRDTLGWGVIVKDIPPILVARLVPR